MINSLFIKRLFLTVAMIYVNVFAAKSTSPVFFLKASGGVYDFVIENNFIYAATDAGVLDIFNFKTKKKIKKILIPNIKNFNGNLKQTKLFSEDKQYGIDG
ncbi:MAG: hypothetical protein DRI94_11775 [Bacteroidetes bacterium]|nr:MAG: hypothetical protein DRI94_11775 [Bacteroidota bacterium]